MKIYSGVFQKFWKMQKTLKTENAKNEFPDEILGFIGEFAFFRKRRFVFCVFSKKIKNS